MNYTLEVYLDKALVHKEDLTGLTLAEAETYGISNWPDHRIEVHETYVTRRNLMTGILYQERYDTPRCCSPSTETYWSM